MSALGKLKETIRGIVGEATQSVDAVRREIEQAKAEREAIADAPVTKDEAVARLEAWLNRCEADFVHLGRAAGFFIARDQRWSLPALASIWVNGTTHAAISNIDPILVSLFRDAIRAKLIAAIDARYGGDAKAGRMPMTAAARDKALADIDKRILDLERRDETLCVEAEEVGLQIQRREDLDPRAFLEVSD